MLTIVRDATDHLQGVCEWWLVNHQGQQDWQAGIYVWVEQLHLSAGAPRTTLAKLIHQIASAAPHAVGAYWVRRDKTGTCLHGFRRAQLLKEVRV